MAQLCDPKQFNGDLRDASHLRCHSNPSDVAPPQATRCAAERLMP